MKKLISFDVDNVLLDTEGLITSFISEIYQVKISQMDVTHWDYYAEHFPKILPYFSKHDLYQDVQSIEKMDLVLKETIEFFGKDKIQIITSTHNNVKNSKDEALDRLFGHLKGFNDIPIIHVGLKKTGEVGGEECHHKYDYSKGTILIDDAIHNIHDHIINNKKDRGILVDFGYGWNQKYSHKKVTRIKKPEEIILDLKKHLK